MAFKKKPDEPKKGAPEYMNTYGDMITLMLAFFVLMYAMSAADPSKFDALKQSYTQAALSIFSNGTGEVFPNDGPSIINLNPPVGNENTAEIEEPLGAETPGIPIESDDIEELEEIREMEAQISRMESDFKTYMAENIITRDITVSNQGDHLLITLPGGMLFDSGRAELRPEAIEALDLVLNELMKMSWDSIRVEGHTDNVPQTSPPFTSNLMLSGARAASVVDYMINIKGYDPAVLEATGKSEYHPVDTNETAEGRARNRRVEIKVYQERGAGASPATTLR
ncbi:MAG: flagellar motor protein MotB [Clostridiales bacterium]|nr:flagellar motor protein MotB [Clostridiales bacterium]